MPSSFHHVPVLLHETLDALRPRPEGIYVDCTAGGGGHSAAIAELLAGGGRIIALDRDPAAVEAAQARIAEALADRPPNLRPRVDVVHAAFSQLDPVLGSLGLRPGDVDGLLADLGVSSHQLDRAERGFSFAKDGPLDLRMDTTAEPDAATLLATVELHELVGILRQGGERKPGRVARAILRAQADDPITTTSRLAEVVSDAVGGRRGARIHPATRTFQALRMHVNDEAGELNALLDSGLRWLRTGGRWAVITFHSGEDAPTKHRFADLARGCVCPPRDPICTCGQTPRVRLPFRSGRTATEEEIVGNPRSRTARLRVAERLEPAHEE